MDETAERDRLASLHRKVLDTMEEGFCLIEVLFDPKGQATDCVFREVNVAFERESRLAGAQGRRLGEWLPDLGASWAQALAPVVLEGEALRFEYHSERLGSWHAVQAFPIGDRHEHLVWALFTCITQRKLDELMARSVVEYAILVLDSSGCVRTWNAGAERIKGYKREQILGRHLSVFYTREDIAAGHPAQVLARAAESGHFEEEGWRVRSDGSRFWASVAVTPLRDSDGKLQGYCKVTRDLTERRRAEEALRLEIQERLRAQEQLRDLNSRLEADVTARTQELMRANTDLLSAKERLQDLSSRLIRAQEEERGRIARELHDDTGQILTLLSMRLADLSPGADDPAVRGCTDLVNEAIAHTRRLALNLRPAILDDLGLDAALEWMLRQQASAAGWAASFRGGLEDRRFSREIETACFRIAQEALTNASRYAAASEVSVTLSAEGGSLVLDVADNGRGFDVAHYRLPQERSRHFGLLSMTERAGLVGAQLAIDSAPGRGTRVHAVFPLHDGSEHRAQGD